MLAVASHAAHRHAAKVHPVVAALTAISLMRAASPRAVVGRGDFQRGVGGFRAGLQKHLGQTLGRHRRQRLGGFEFHRVAHLEWRRIVQDGGLTLDGLDNRAAVMAGVHTTGRRSHPAWRPSASV